MLFRQLDKVVCCGSRDIRELLHIRCDQAFVLAQLHYAATQQKTSPPQLNILPVRLVVTASHKELYHLEGFSGSMAAELEFDPYETATVSADFQSRYTGWYELTLVAYEVTNGKS